MTGSDAKADQSRKRKSKKRSKSDLDDSTVVKDASNAGMDAELNVQEPTMAEKLASLELQNDGSLNGKTEEEATHSTNIPSADSVHVMLKQALNADDHSLLLSCLYTSDDKVISKSTALLNPSDVLKFLKSLLSMIELRGAVIICALPWLRSLISQHASSVASLESSMPLLNSLYQIIESRTSTFNSALHLSTCIDCLLAGIPKAEADETAAPVVIYEDRDSEEEEEDEEEEEEEDNATESDGLRIVINSEHNFDGSEIMSD